ncbi:MAG: CHC2 zinc finger domain-containing protein [Gemmatimonadota bacterium]
MTYRNRVDAERARRGSILRIADALGFGDPVPRGTEYAVLCPFHDDHDPSLSLSIDRGLWYCFVCGEGGDGIDLVMRARALGFRDAVAWINARA